MKPTIWTISLITQMKMAREKQAEYEYICEIIRKTLKEKQAELLIAIVLDGVSVTEYAEREGVTVEVPFHIV